MKLGEGDCSKAGLELIAAAMSLLDMNGTIVELMSTGTALGEGDGGNTAADDDVPLPLLSLQVNESVAVSNRQVSFTLQL